MSAYHKIGFMQGRLSPIIDNKIQSFPWQNWQAEFSTARANNFRLMEWTLDHEDLYKNPLMTILGVEKILNLCKKFKIKIPSLTGDCFMQSPFWKSEGRIEQELKKDFLKVIKAGSNLGVELIVVPLVDNGRIENIEQSLKLKNWLLEHQELFGECNVKIVFESDLGPQELSVFMEDLPPTHFGINYDIGNSAASGFDPREELACYGKRVLNVHIKDRILGGTTVPIGSGAADFVSVFSALQTLKYDGNFILQTARSEDGDHAGVLTKYREQVLYWLDT